jgi:hypothetical protein
MSGLGWTLPYCDERHLLGLRHGCVATVMDYGDESEAWITRGLDTLGKTKGTLSECQAWAEWKARDLNLIELAPCGCYYVELNYGKGHSVKRVPHCQAGGPCAGSEKLYVWQA